MQVNPYAAPSYGQYPGAPPPPHPSRSGMGHVRANAIIQLVALALHALFAASIAFNLATDGFAGPGGTTGSAHDQGQWVGYWGTILFATVWSAVGLVWTPINAYGLWKLRPWARVSTLIYSGISLITCCGTPIGIYGLVSLLRADVRALLTPATGSVGALLGAEHRLR